MIFLQINIQGLVEEKFHRPLTNIANLFFEETKVFMENHSDQAELTVNFDLRVSDWIHVQAEIPGSELLHANYEKVLPNELSQKEKDRMIKHAISYVYLSVLQTYTGMTQKWGILTGIRPTKLLHKMLHEGMPKEEAHQKLQTEYMISDEKIQLMQNIIDRQLSVVPDLYQLQNEVSIYIGIPFCPTNVRIVHFLPMRLMVDKDPSIHF